jgi:hypothetical protein
MHRWSRDNAGYSRNGYVLLRDCLLCGMEEWRTVQDYPQGGRRGRQWRLGGKIHKEGLALPPCPSGDAGFYVMVMPTSWTIRAYVGPCKPMPLLMKGGASSLHDAVAQVTQNLREQVAGTGEQQDVRVDLGSAEASP